MIFVKLNNVLGAGQNWLLFDDVVDRVAAGWEAAAADADTEAAGGEV